VFQSKTYLNIIRFRKMHNHVCAKCWTLLFCSEKQATQNRVSKRHPKYISIRATAYFPLCDKYIQERQ